MKIAVISDVHSNMEALRAVLAEVSRLGAAEILSLGDVVGYGPEPAACIETLRDAAKVNLLGNHDAAVAGRTPVEEFNGNARRAVEWTRTVLAGDEISFLSSLPYEERRGGHLLVHASPENPPAWNYIMSIGSARRSFDFFNDKVCFVGHTHVPFIVARGEKGELDVVEELEATLREDRRYLVNTGSVGQPRDGDPRASFALVDEEAGTVQIRRVPYDVERTQALMRSSGLPDFLVERLSQGR